jgi:hypothetical protein
VSQTKLERALGAVGAAMVAFGLLLLLVAWL